MKTKFRNLNFEIKDVKEDGTSGIVEGYAAVFNNIDYGDDVIEQGAFKRTIKNTKGIWPILKMHNPSERIGYNLKAEEDDHGLLITEQLALDVQAGREQFALTKLAHKVGGPDGLSIGYDVIKAEPDKERPSVRRLKELRMWEHSHVTFGMNNQALTTAAKALRDNPDAGLGDHTDLFFKHMEFLGYEFKEVLQALREYESAKQSKDPGRLIHSLDRANNILKGA